MRAIIQRVSQASVNINGEEERAIGRGLMILLGIEEPDDRDDIAWLVRKISGMRLFNDEEGKMNFSVRDIDGEMLVISQFTLHASVKKGNRPSYTRAAKPDTAVPLYEDFIKALEKEFPAKVKTGEFGADMKVGLINDGPVTIFMDSKNKE